MLLYRRFKMKYDNIFEMISPLDSLLILGTPFCYTADRVSTVIIHFHDFRSSFVLVMCEYAVAV